MSTATLPPPTPLMTAEEFLRRHGDERGVELVRGVVRRKAMPGARHGEVCHRIGGEFFVYLKAHPLGHVFTHDTFVRTEQSPVSFRGPDIQFIRYERTPKGTVPVGVPDVPPDLVIEVRSPSDTWKSMTRKALEYLDAEVKVVILIDPDDRTATTFRTDAKPQSIGADGTLTVPDLLPGFAVPMNTLFE